MSTALRSRTLRVVRKDNGRLMTPKEFDAIQDCDDNYRYEIIQGVLVVNPPPSITERDPNDELGRIFRNYGDAHPELRLKTVSEEYVRTASGRRIADRVVWALGRLPNLEIDPATIAIEFVSERRRDWLRDYETKRDEYMAVQVGEYWIIDRFRRMLTVFRNGPAGVEEHTFHENDIYRTPLLPGFELPFAKLLAIANEWPMTRKRRNPGS